MRCDEVNTLILSHLDGTLSGQDEAILREHLAGCDPCARELAAQKRMSGALRAMGLEEVQAPPELCGLVMGRLRARRRKTLTWLPAAWRSAIAAAAAALLIAGGSIGITGGLRIADVGKMIGLNTPAPQGDVKTPGGTPIIAEEDPGRTVPSQTDVVTPAPGHPGVADGVAEEGRDGVADVPDIDSNNAVTNPSVLSVEEPLAFLQDGLRIESTVLKVAVDDLAGAKAKSVAMADGAGATTQVFPEGQKDVMLRLTVPSDRAPQLISALTGIGSLLQREDGSNDVTSSYNETVVEYNDLLSRKKSAPDTEERRRLEARAASCKQLLDAWQAEGGKRVVTVWLVGK